MSSQNNAEIPAQKTPVSAGLPIEHLLAVFEYAPVGIALVGLDGRPFAVNPFIVKLTGYAESEILTMHGLEMTHPDDRASAIEPMQALIEGKKDTVQVENRFMRKNDDIYWVRQRISLVRDPDGNPAYVIVMVEDISQQKIAEKELQDSEARFRAIFDTAAVGIGIMGLDGKLTNANPALCEMYGYSRQELIGQSSALVTHPGDLVESQALYQEMFEQKRDTITGVRRYVRKNGEVFWGRFSMTLVRDGNNNPLYIFGLVADINEERTALAKLQASEASFRALFDNATVGMAMVSLDRRILAINRTTERIIGYQTDELLGTNPSDLSLGEDRRIGMEHFQALINGEKENFWMEKRYVRKNGEVFWARISYALVRDNEGKPQYLVGSIEDINEQRLTAEKLAAQEKEYRRMLEQRVEERTREWQEANLRLVAEIEQRQRAEETLASKAVEEAIVAERTRLARDLHDAVTQTLFSASIIAEVLPDLWEVDVNEARKSNEELRQLTRGALAEMRTLLLELRPAALTQARLPDLLQQLSEAVTGRARIPVRLEVKGSYDLPPDVKVAFYRITQESLNNIVKYARATQVDILINLDCCNVHLEVKDNGIGFDPVNVKPTSLGMRIMRERAEAIRAHFQLSSTPGQGTIISVDWKEDELFTKESIEERGEA